MTDLYAQDALWSKSDIERFHDSRKQLYTKIGRLNGLLPIMLRLGDRLYEVSLQRPVKHVVESVLGNVTVVYEQFSELCCMLILVLTYRIIIELLHNSPGESYPEFFGLAFVTEVFFTIKDVSIVFGFMSLDIRLVKRHMSHISTLVDWLTAISVITTLCVMDAEQTINGYPYLGIVAGLLWWKLLIHLKGMVSQSSAHCYSGKL